LQSKQSRIDAARALSGDRTPVGDPWPPLTALARRLSPSTAGEGARIGGGRGAASAGAIGVARGIVALLRSSDAWCCFGLACVLKLETFFSSLEGLAEGCGLVAVPVVIPSREERSPQRPLSASQMLADQLMYA
jgi:hypothetical protein